MKQLNLFLASLLFCSLLSSCDETTDNVSVDFSQTDMLSNYADNLIVPAFENYASATTDLKSKVEAFTTNPTEETLLSVQDAAISTYTAWSKVNAYQYGKAVEVSLLSNTNTFPTKFSSIEDRITSGEFNLDAISSTNVKGLPAVEYLLFNTNSADLIASFTDEQNRKDYLTQVVDILDNHAQTVLSDWEGGYADTFSVNKGNDPSSSLSYIVNEYNKAFERCKNQRVGYALGKNSLSGVASPKSVEAYYSEESLSLLKSNVVSLQEIFNGKDGKGLADYLDAYYQAGSIEEDLAGKINDQFDMIESKLEDCTDPFSNHIEAQDQVVESLYDEMTKLVVMIKSEMPSALSVKITYQDSDGD
ncbi:imelysin family protein [Flammeovirga sp. SubArs3]|uniref:imelysin family protein n=1 Tax=Flammeovirga sp. SubArs3 TaxID=2995316 RepID=UPI00248C7D63|nr:imelysin family protein [Flammeovirga sp. SubArs3]